LRAAIADSSISQLVQWQRVAKDETVFVPAGTIHAIGAGLVLAEVQQRSDTTYRLFDYGRGRELHADAAVAVSLAGPAEPQPLARRLSDERSLLVANSHFVMERITLLPGTQWTLNAARETWLLALSGQARIQGASLSKRDAFTLGIGQAIFAEADRATIAVGSEGLTALVAYGGPTPEGDLLELSGTDGLPSPARPASRQPTRPLTATEAAS
jgi:mannose-6-phosphate isomerase